MKSTFAIFDVDYTIIKGDSMFLMLIFGIKKRPLIIFYTPIILVKIVLALLGIIDIRVAKEAIYIPLKFLTEKELEGFYNEVLLNNLNIEVMKRLKQHKEEGHHILLASASPEAYLRWFKKNNYIDGIIGTKIKKIDDKYINEIEGENCKGSEKLKRINQYLEEKNLEIDFENSFAYSDSLGDKPMLSLVKNRYKVSKTQGIIGEFIW
ncbi:HAD-IB family hydrolase [Clostridium gasigenes]|uniref:HAD-IB family hydrolase n=1 Tax=Clostridium gasigenes TaxID=94869 RepID=UPI001C0BD5CB|nr:HAD-IB family hydrolase [Clostridium gasigenes]MBU3131076.1 HAD-IB family hydrolase [Clostridium gasigenes]